MWEYRGPGRLDASGAVAMISRLWQKRAALFLLVVYSIDLAWLLNWREAFGDVPWWGIALGLTVRFGFMGFILFMYLRLKKAPQEVPVVTKAMKNESVRSMRIVHAFLLAAIVGYLYVSERWPRPTSHPPAVFVETFSILAAIMVVIAIGFRRKLLPSAMDALRHERGDAAALGRWRMANILSMVLAETVALYGLVLRAVGGSRPAAWSFFVVSFILMLLWRPRLDEATGSAATPQPN